MLSGLCESETFYDWYLSRLTATAAKLEVQFVLWTGSGRREKERRWKRETWAWFFLLHPLSLSLSLSLSLRLAINSPGQCLFWLWLNMNTHCMFNCIRCTLQITWWSESEREREREFLGTIIYVLMYEPRLLYGQEKLWEHTLCHTSCNLNREYKREEKSERSKWMAQTLTISLVKCVWMWMCIYKRRDEEETIVLLVSYFESLNLFLPVKIDLSIDLCSIGVYTSGFSLSLSLSLSLSRLVTPKCTSVWRQYFIHPHFTFLLLCCVCRLQLFFSIHQ